MVAPFAGFSIKGFIWYQGESNLKNGYQYHTYLDWLIHSWRKAWGNDALPFTVVQLPNFKKREADPNKFADWAVVREAQLKALSIPDTHLVTTLDVGNPDDVHPTDKQTVGERVANQLLSKIYHQPIQADGPLYASFKTEQNKLRIYFQPKGANLVFKQGCPVDSVFAVAGADRKFHWAKAVIENNTVVVWSDQVAKPVAVRYAWANNPCVVLYSDKQVPASPFRTDEWPVTDPRKGSGDE
jgi:sialate O-acetylesterase